MNGRQHDVAVDRRAKGLGCLDRRADLTEKNVTRVVTHGRGQSAAEVAILDGNLEAPPETTVLTVEWKLRRILDRDGDITIVSAAFLEEGAGRSRERKSDGEGKS